MELMKEMLSHPFMVRALTGGILISLCGAILGVNLVLKHYSMIGDGLSHVSFGTLAVAVAMGWSPLAVSVPVVILAAFLLLRITENSKLRSDAAIAMISASALAFGIMVSSMSKKVTIDPGSYMFGSVLAMDDTDVFFSKILFFLVLSIFFFFYHKIFAVTFDQSFSKATGVNVSVYNMILASLTAVTIVLGMRMMGAMLMSSLIVFPVMTSMRVFQCFRSTVISSVIIAAISFVAGMLLSFLYSVPAGAAIVLINIILFILFWILEQLRQMFV